MRNLNKLLILTAIFNFSLISCSSNSGATSGPTIADNTQYYDTVTKELKLTKSYQGKSFLSDGIGLATVDAFTDGDTTRFKLSSGETVIVRYYEIDTPESTSSIEKWGKAASNFTKNALSNATEIVLEATGPRAEHDSYGTRYLGYVWYKTADYSEFKLLNLELVENGFTDNKGTDTEDYPYYSYFRKANNYARQIELRIYSKLDDPLYSDDPIDMNIKEFNSNPELYYDEENGIGAKVKLVACLTDLTISNSGTYTYTAVQIDEKTNKLYSINVYAGYSSGAASGMVIGHLYNIYGNVQLYYGKYQISGIVYDSVYTLDGYTCVTQKNYYLTFNSSISYISQYKGTLYSNLTVLDSKIENDLLIIECKSKLNTKTGYSEEESLFTIKTEVPSNYNNKFTAGTEFSVNGFQFEKDSSVITVLNYSDLKIK